MRIPSNRIYRPPSDPDPDLPSPALGLAILTVTGVVLWVCNLSTVATFVIEAFVLLFWTHMLLEQRRLERVAAARSGESICSFARSFDCRVVDTWVIRAVYDVLQETLTAASFPVRAGDHCLKDLALDDEDLDDLAPDIAERCHRSLDDTEFNPFYGQVDTVRELVLFIDRQPPARLDAA